MFTLNVRNRHWGCMSGDKKNWSVYESEARERDIA